MQNLERSAAARCGAAALLLAVAWAVPAAAQVGTQTPSDTTGTRTPPASVRATASPTASIRDSTGTPAPLLDMPVSRTAYALGPGDVLSVAIFGDVSRVLSVAVGPEGTAVVPDFGLVRLQGASLEQAESRIRALVGRYLQNVDVSVVLSRVRAFKVFVVGDVLEPGVRVATAATRVSEVVPTSAAGGVHRRNVLLRRATGDTITVDLARFNQVGDVSANPTLREGDALVVPTVDRTIAAYGRVQYPGVYEYRPGETLAQFLSVANGGGNFPENAADTVRLVRFSGPQQRATIQLSRQEALGAHGAAIALQPFDAVYVAMFSNFKQQKTATVNGQVVRPGTYPIRPDTTTVRELVAMAGGFTPLASLVDATLQRQPREASMGERQLAQIPSDVMTEDERRVLRVRAQSDPSLVVIDFAALFAGDPRAYDQPLRDGDLLVIPERRSEVLVLGAVRRPGIVRFQPGLGPAAFLAQAGWVTERADLGHAVVVKANTGTRLRLRDNVRIEEGDGIIVPYKRETTWTERLQLAGAIASTLTAIALTASAFR